MIFHYEGTAQRPPSAAVVIPVHHYEVVVLLALPCEETNGVSARSCFWGNHFLSMKYIGSKLYVVEFHSARVALSFYF